MSFISPTPGSSTSTTTSNSTSTSTPDPNITADWNQVNQGASAEAQNLINNPTYPGQMVAGPTDLMNQYFGQTSALGQGVNVMPTQNTMQQASEAMMGTQRDPNAINLPQFNSSSFQPGALNLPQFGATPNVNAVGGVSGLASSYLVNPQQVKGGSVSAQNVNAPGAIAPISGIQQVTGPNLNQYSMGPAQTVNALPLNQLQMQAAGNVAPSGLASTQSWTDPGTAAQYMSPYTQQVVDAQLAQAQTQEQQQLAQQGAQAAQAGAFGGSRAAVENANTSIGYQQLAAQLQAQGLQSAYQQGQQQFNTQQQLGQQAQQFNIGTGLQAGLANQQVQQQANLQNLSALLQTQGLGAQTGLQAQLANQQAGLTVGGQNLGAQLQTQGLGAQLGMQGQLANQQVGLQSALANQQALEFSAGQQMQGQLANQQANLQAGTTTAQLGMQGQLANQAAGIQTGLAAQQMGLQGAQFNATQGLTAQEANQAAQMQALGMTFQGGLQGALQTQNLGLSGAEFGGQLGLGAAGQQYQLQQGQQGLNMQGIGQAANIQNAAANLGLSGFGANLAGAAALGQGAAAQQGLTQAQLAALYQNWQNAMQNPMVGTGFQAQTLAMQPVGWTNTNQGTSTTNASWLPPQASGLSQAIQAGLAAAGAAGGLGWKPFGGAKGGLMPRDLRPTGLAKVIRMKKPAAKTRGLGNFSMAA